MSVTKAQLVGGVGISTVGDLSVYGGLNVTGVVTATSLVGDATGLTGTPNVTVGFITATGTSISGDVTVGGNVSIAGTLTYEDVTNIDSIGIVTARSGIQVTSGDVTLGTGVTISGATSNVFTVSTNGTKRIEIQADGDINIDSGGVFYDATNNRLGIGTTSPGSILDINGPVTLRSSGTVRGYFGDVDSDNNMQLRSEAQTVFKINNNEAARIDASRRLLVGTSSASAISKFIVQGYVGGSDGFMSVRRGAVGADNQRIGAILFDDSSENVAARIDAYGDGVWGANDYPGRLVFSTTADGASSPTERMRISNTGGVRLPDVYNQTIALSANVFIDTDGTLKRATSSIKYKTNVETLEDQYADAVLNCRPVWYQSTSAGDNPNWGFWGFIAEEVAEIDPRLVQWKTVDQVINEDGSRETIPLDTPEPENVAYDRFVPHLLNLIKRQQQAIETLEQRLDDAGIN